MKKYVCTIICIIISFCISVNFSDIKRSLLNDVFRVDIGANIQHNAVKILSDNRGIEVAKPTWCTNCVVVSGDVITHDDEPLKLRLSVAQDDKISIRLRGKDVKEQGHRVPVYVKYAKVAIDGDFISDAPITVWHDQSYAHGVDMRAGQVLELTIVPMRPNLYDLLGYIDFNFYLFLFSLFVLYILCSVCEHIFNKNQNISRIDIVFVLVFFVLLFVPMMRISGAEKSLLENRMLATHPELLTNGAINEKYGVQFDSWFNDRFNGRDMLLSLYTDITYSMLNIYQNDKALYIKKNGWMFGKVKDTSQRKKDLNIANLKKFDEFCAQNNIKLYVLLVPPKEFIYADILRDNYGFDYKSLHENDKYITQITSALSGDRIIYPYTELIQAKEHDYVFFKQSHHWTDYGAYVGYKLLSDRIKKDFKNYRIESLDDYNKSRSVKIRDDWGRKYNKGHTTNLLRLKDKADEILDTEYNYYDSKHASDVSEERLKYTKIFKNKNKHAKYRLFLFGNSQNEDLLQFLSHSVKDMKYLRVNKEQQNAEEQLKFMKHYKQELLDFKPDIAVLCISSENFYSLINDFYKD